jgi:hypothetical protein
LARSRVQDSRVATHPVPLGASTPSSGQLVQQLTRLPPRCIDVASATSVWHGGVLAISMTTAFQIPSRGTSSSAGSCGIQHGEVTACCRNQPVLVSSHVVRFRVGCKDCEWLWHVGGARCVNVARYVSMPRRIFLCRACNRNLFAGNLIPSSCALICEYGISLMNGSILVSCH